MIVIVVNGETLDIPAGLTLERELETSIFRRNSEAADFTYPVDLPLTETNRKALNHPDHLAATPTRSFDCEITIDGIYAKGVMYVESISYAEHTARVSISGDYGGFWKDAANIKVNELALGGIRTVGSIDTGATASQFLDPLTPNKVELFYTPCTTADHINDIINGVITDSDYLFYGAVDEKQNIEFIHEKQRYQNNEREGKIPDIRSIINPFFYNDAGDKGIIDPVKAYIETSFILGSSGSELVTHDRYFWVPFFRLAFVIKKCFEDMGYTVNGDILTNANFNAVTLYNTYSINQCTVTESIPSAGTFKIEVVHAATEIDPRNHVPRMTVPFFLREVAKAYNLQYVINYTTKEVTINLIGGIIHNLTSILDITKLVSLRPETNYEGFGGNMGYHFIFEGDSQDGAIGEKTIETIDGLNDRGIVANYAALSGISTPVHMDIAYVRAENAWYQYIVDRWMFYGFHFKEHKTTANPDLYAVRSKAVPVPMARFNLICRMQFPNATFFTTTDIGYENDFLLPYSKIGIEGKELLGIQRFFGTNAGLFPELLYTGRFRTITASVKPDTIKLCNYMGLAYPSNAASVASHPCGSSTIYDAKGTQRQGIKHIWNDPDDEGLYPSYWKAFTDQILDTTVIDFDILVDTDLYKDFDPQQMFVKIEDVLFLCDKINYRFPLPNVGTIRLVRYG